MHDGHRLISWGVAGQASTCFNRNRNSTNRYRTEQGKKLPFRLRHIFFSAESYILGKNKGYASAALRKMRPSRHNNLFTHEQIETGYRSRLRDRTRNGPPSSQSYAHTQTPFAVTNQSTLAIFGLFGWSCHHFPVSPRRSSSGTGIGGGGRFLSAIPHVHGVAEPTHGSKQGECARKSSQRCVSIEHARSIETARRTRRRRGSEET